ncbi:alpha/beta hydrolase [Aspergillus affinis]|uniref:alpha/beta hydrolase n=1 Tax=Aspergillus affinis TaxID=1070780 RepID=UPI0022FE2369|nr:alpha/beta-hydrolase [Aspergillus affinis]KAI9036932.1 alpha/beta-hydrolase [Aspergillus affinis]
MEFPELHIQPAQSSHTHTAILLHGRGSNGPEFAEELFSSTTSRNKTLAESLPSWRWVFPTSRERWDSRFQEDLCAWFEAYSLTDIQERQELQVDGLRESVAYILDLLKSEIHLLDGKTSHVYLGGMSQGMATALWTLFCATGRVRGQLGGFLGFCGWLPFAHQLEDLLGHPNEAEPPSHHHKGSQVQSLVSRLFPDSIGKPEVSQGNESGDTFLLSPPVFLSHGTDDAWVSVQLGRQAARILRQISVDVEWYEFESAEGDGHWVKEPEGFDQMVGFLARTMQEQSGRGDY